MRHRAASKHAQSLPSVSGPLGGRVRRNVTALFQRRRRDRRRGTPMKTYAEEGGELRRPRRLLVAGHKAGKVLLITPLFRLYVTRGLVVTKIYQVIQYEPKACFRAFVEDGAQARRRGDVEGAGSDTKLWPKTPNSNSTQPTARLPPTRKSSMTVVLQRRERRQARQRSAFSRPLSTQRRRLRSGEVQVDHRSQCACADRLFRVRLHQVAYARFYHEVLDRFVDRADFELGQMDTDSLYMALSKDSLETVVRDDKKAEF